MKFRKSDSVMTTIALLSGIAVGAVISALFASKSGKETRAELAEAFKGIVGVPAAKTDLEIKGQLVPDLRAQVKESADHLTGAPDETPDLSRTTLKQTGPKSRQVPTEEV